MASKYVTAIRRRLKELADKEKAEFAQGFFKTGPGEYGDGDKFLGIRVPVLRKLAKENRNLKLNEALEMLRSKWHEERLLAVIILVQLFKSSDNEEKTNIYDAYLAHSKYINNWDIVDASAHLIVGPYLDGKSKKPIYELSKSSDIWERRIAMMATYCFIKSGSFNESLRVAKTLLHDPEDLIHKSVGWMLREIGNRDRSVEEAFLRKHYKTMPRTMLRYAIEKFPEPLRKRYLKGSV